MKLLSKVRAGYLVTLGAGLVLGFTAVGTAAAVSGSPTAPAAAATHHYSLAASAFAPDRIDPSSDQDYSNTWDPAVLRDPGDRCFNAGLSLPPNAVLQSVTMYYTKGSTHMSFQVNRQNLSGHTARVLAEIDPGTTTGTPVYSHVTKDIPKSEATVNMTKFAYSAGVCPAGNTTFSGLTITYTVSG